jgi:hypothetical protein
LARLRREMQENAAAERQGAQEREQQEARLTSLRDMMGAIRIAVLAPCIKLQIGDGETVQVGSPQQVDFRSMGQLLEETVTPRTVETDELRGNRGVVPLRWRKWRPGEPGRGAALLVLRGSPMPSTLLSASRC